jgi:DNA-binding CsgD family transcriptional regulator
MELLERTTHLAELSALWRQAAAGQGRLVLLGGEAGVGKTALVRRFCDDLPPGVRILSGACDPLSTPRALGPLLDIAAEVKGEFGRLVTSALPQHRLFGAFLSELNRAAEPTLAVVEDVHWADEASLDLLRFLGRRLGSTHGLVIATFRDDEVGPRHPLQLALGDLATAGAAHRLPLLPLSVESVRTLATGSGFDAVALHRQTGGNPFFVTEVLAAGAVGIPASVRDAVLARAGRLSAGGRATLDAAAVIGAPIEPWLLRAVLGAGGDASEECIASGMLRSVGNMLVFRHELARAAVLEAIAPLRRSQLHTQVLALLRTVTPQEPARLAHHAEEAGDRKAVLAYAPLAAERAAALRAHREATAQYARALRFADGLPQEQLGTLLEAYSYQCYLTDHLSEAIDACQSALNVWRRVGHRLKEGDSQRRLSRLFNFAGQKREAEEAARAALDVLEGLPPGPELAMAYSNVSLLNMLAWDSREAKSWGERAIALAEQFGETEVLVHALLNVGAAGLVDVVDADHAREKCERSLLLAHEHDLIDHAARAYAILSSSYVEAYQFDRADAYFAEGIAYCTEYDLDYMRPFLLAWRAMARAFQGRWVEAYETAFSVAREETMPRVSRVVALVALGRIRSRQGGTTANDALDEALALALQSGELRRLGPVRLARAEAAWLAGDPGRVVAEAADLFDIVVRRNHPRLAGELAFWLWRAGALDKAPPGALEPIALQIAGQWSEAAARWQALGCPYEAAWALADGGDEASLRAAHAEFAHLGAAPAAAIVSRRLREMGVRHVPRGPRPATRANPALLTQREMQVLALIADGLSNVEIAQRIYVSPRTVGHHVSAILAKLKAGTRAEAVQAAARLGIAGQNRSTTSPI